MTTRSKPNSDVMVVFCHVGGMLQAVTGDGKTCFCCRDTKHLNVFDGQSILCPPCPVCLAPQWNTWMGQGRLDKAFQQQPKRLPYPAFSLTIVIDGIGGLEQAWVDADCEICRQTNTLPLWLSFDGDGQYWNFPCPICQPLRFEAKARQWGGGLVVLP